MVPKIPEDSPPFFIVVLRKTIILYVGMTQHVADSFSTRDVRFKYLQCHVDDNGLQNTGYALQIVL